MLKARRFDKPLITPALHPSIGENIQGPSLIRVPDWLPEPLGRYYLYFADHKGSYIRLAYADALAGPWRIHEPGSLQLADSGFPVTPPQYSESDAAIARERAPRPMPHDPLLDMTIPHIASPDVHVNKGSRQIVMYFHGLESFGRQVSRVALSDDGIVFRAQPQIIARSYLRVFQHEKYFYGLAMPGVFYRSADGLTGYEQGPTLFGPQMRHAAVLKRGDTLYVYWTRVGDAPERILRSEVSLAGDWLGWKESLDSEVLRPERDWEGAGQPNEPSMRSVAYGQVNQLRDPAVFTEDDRTYLLYAIAGEAGIAIAELH